MIKKKMDITDLDHLMSPSKYSKKHSADAAVIQHIEKSSSGTNKARSSLNCELGVEYQAGGPKLDIYYPSDISAAQNVLIYIHGGYWQELGVQQAGMAGVPMAKKDIILVGLGYDLAPKVNMTTIVEQCRAGCAFIAKKFPGKRLFVSGHSAGAHLASMMLISNWSEYLTSYPFTGAILVSGVYDLQPVQKCYVNEPLQLTDEEVLKFSPLLTECSTHLTRLKSLGVKCVLAEGEHESPEFKKQREKFHKKLVSNGIDCKQLELKDEDHFTVVERLAEEEYELTKVIVDFIKEQ